MFIRAGNRIVNTDNIVEIRVYPAREEKWVNGQRFAATELEVQIETTGIRGSGEGTEIDLNPYSIRFTGSDAEKILVSVPVYEPVMKGTS